MIGPLEFPVSGFTDPGRLWVLLLLPAFIALYVVALRRKTRSGMRFTNTTLLGQVVPKQSQWLRHVTVALSLLSLVTLAVAWARPLGIDRVPRERATVVVVIDVSLSMTATDVSPTRLDAAKQAAITFVNNLPSQYNVALVSLSGNPAVRLPPVQDRAALVRAITTLEPQDSTAIGSAIYAAMAAMDQAPTGDGVAPGMVVLLSDGANTAGQSPLQAANDASQRKLPIYTIAYGTDNGYVDVDGQRERVPPDPQTLTEISQITGGTSYTADDTGELASAYKHIGSDLGYEKTYKEITATAAGVGLVFALLAAVGAVMMGARWR